MGRNNTILLIAISFSTICLIGFIVALMDSKAGEVAGALGNVIGGTIGALGAAAAVYLTLTLQRDDETIKVRLALVAEVMQLAKFPCGQLDNCMAIYLGTFVTAPRAKLAPMMQAPPPVIYPAVASNLTRHPKIETIVAFYGCFGELHSTVEMVMGATDRGMYLQKDDVLGMAILLREMCILAESILLYELPSYEDQERKIMIIGVINFLKKAVRSTEGKLPSMAEYQIITGQNL